MSASDEHILDRNPVADHAPHLLASGIGLFPALFFMTATKR